MYMTVAKDTMIQNINEYVQDSGQLKSLSRERERERSDDETNDVKVSRV
jgi:hypothetical protein